ncbi:hypothetical protein NA57DRAFT_63292 [Rhizodiscina lignyota]|uniref:Ribosomal RNA-processing protein 40 n=1 Tax=Rhizodiscina lignyota TaxID=1504668 RepID=A0A9P4ITN3_9PEZI|nr:hypothetical protein NA57DRAFT_63292 [Rhizodiscina lignyota]
MTSTLLLLPGDEVPSSLLPKGNHKPLVLGPGLRHAPPSSVRATVSGTLTVDARKNALWIETNRGRYIPHVNDLVIATVLRSSSDFYHCTITPHAAQANLPQLAFESATRKTRPQLAPGALVYARISSASRDMDPELSCVSASSGKADGLGPLKGGMLFDVSLGFCRRLLLSESKVPLPAEQGGGAVTILEALAEKIGFEVAVGRNGKLWVDGGDVKMTLAVGKALQQTDQERLTLDQQKKLAAKTLRELGS